MSIKLQVGSYYVASNDDLKDLTFLFHIVYKTKGFSGIDIYLGVKKRWENKEIPVYESGADSQCCWFFENGREATGKTTDVFAIFKRHR